MSIIKNDILKDSGLLVEAPLAQIGLVRDVTLSQTPTRIVNRYRSKSKLRCAVCKTENKHNNGVTLELSDGHFALCGLTCATGLFGPRTIEKLKLEFEARERYSVLRQRAGPTIIAFEKAVSCISDEWIAADDSIEKLVKSISDRRIRRLVNPIPTDILETFKMLRFACRTRLGFQKTKIVEALSICETADVSDAQVEKLQLRRRHIADNIFNVLEKHRNAKKLLDNPKFISIIKEINIPLCNIVNPRDIEHLWRSLNRS